LSSIDNSWQHVACVGLLFKSGPLIQIPAKYVNVVEAVEEPYLAAGGRGAARARQTCIAGIGEMLRSMYRESKSFHEIGAPWAVKSMIVHYE
jgi:hypothetical protein